MSLHYSGRWSLSTQSERHVPPGEASALLETLRYLGEPPEPIAPAEALSLDAAYEQCVAITRFHSRSFYFSSQLLPPHKRLAVRALYAFCRTTDDTVDCAEQNPDHALARWVHLVHAQQAPPNHAVLLAWNDTASRYNIPQSLVDELLAGVAMDLRYTRYATFDDLWLYCYRVASVVGLLAMEIIGYQSGAHPYAITLGIALQLTNILRDVGEDAARGRIYLPQEDLARFGMTDDDILNHRRDERFRELMLFQMQRAHTLYQEAWPGIALLSRDGQFAIAAAADLYRGILRKIVVNDYDVFQKRAHVSFLEKLWMLPGIRRRVHNLPPLIPSQE